MDLEFVNFLIWFMVKFESIFMWMIVTLATSHSTYIFKNTHTHTQKLRGVGGMCQVSKFLILKEQLLAECETDIWKEVK